MADNEFLTGYLSGQGETRNNGMFSGGGWEGLLGLIVIASLFGNGSLGWGGGNNAALQGMATRADINEGFALNNITGGITSIQQGIADSTYAVNNSLTGGFHGVSDRLCDLGSKLDACCCDNKAAIADLKYTIATENCATRNLMQTNTRDIIDSQNNNTRSILDFMVQEKLATKDATIAQLQNQLLIRDQNAFFAANQNAQTAELLSRLATTTTAAA